MWPLFPSGGNDDSYITYWAAYGLSEFGKLINYNGDSIEQSSSLLLVFILAALRWVFGIEPQTAGPIVSICAAILSFAVVAWATKLAHIRTRYAPLFLLSTFVPFTYWSTSGMESSLAALSSILAIATLGAWIDSASEVKGRLALASGASVVAAVLVRPETPFILLGSIGGLLVTQVGWALRGRSSSSVEWRRSGVACLAATAALLALMIWRHRSFGELFPNSAVSKIGGFNFENGWNYFHRNLDVAGVALGFCVFVGIVGVAFGCLRRGLPSVVVMAALFASLQIGFVIVSGGDWMPAGRLLVPAAPAFVILVGTALDFVERVTKLGALVSFIGLATHGVMKTAEFGQHGGNSSLPASDQRAVQENPSLARKYGFFDLHNRGHRRDALLLESLLPALRERVENNHRPFTMMSGQAGMVPYYVFREFYGRGRFVDGYSLTSTQHLECIPKRYKGARIHGILISDQYVLDQSEKLRRCGIDRPDVWFSTGDSPKYLSSKGFRLVYTSKPGADKAWAALAQSSNRSSRH